MLTESAALNKDRAHARSRMEHRHFAAVAAIIATLPMTDEDRECVAEHFAGELRHTNDRFDKRRFLAACKC